MRSTAACKPGPLLPRLGRNKSGIAITEFALCLPALCLLGLGGLEAANLALAYLRVSNIALKTADNAARVRISIDEDDVKEIFTGASLMGKSMNFAQNGRIIMSSIEPVLDSTGTVKNQWIRWQRCTGALADNSTHGNEDDGKTTSQDHIAGYGVPGKGTIAAKKGYAVILVEVDYNYQPLVANNWLGGVVKITATQAMPVRDRTDQSIKNASNLTNAQKALCSNTHTAIPV